MTIQQVVFAVLAVAVIGAALFVVTTGNLFRGALMLILVFFGMAGFYVLLDNGLFAVAQVMIYIGAISILIIFAVMLTRGMQAMIPRNAQATGAAVAAAALFVAIFLAFGPLRLTVDFSAVPVLSALFRTETARTLGDVPWQYANQPVPETYIADFGRALVNINQYLLPFLLIAFLVDAVLAGAVHLARQRKPAELIAERREIAEEEAEEAAALRGAASPEPLPQGAMAATTTQDH
ncbi:MAG: NADH-quinone oxidoreductase subunit J [Anaerolineae bacterium]|nr:NADH-quinone oxidoreductase subunit J [Thermoflexales bacterium]MDW8396308.1 NADH-quinone oxidoreductase subunit J [Anaerolineae bacterium]